MNELYCDSDFRSLPVKQLKSAVTALESYLTTILDEQVQLPEGLGNISSAAGDLSYAVSLTRNLAAAHVVFAGASELSFIAATGDEQLLLGSVKRCATEAASRAPWWESLDTVPVEPPSRIPSFLELALLLAGHVEFSQNISWESKGRDAQLEAAHFRGLAEEQAGTIHRLQAQLNRNDSPSRAPSDTAWTAAAQFWDQEESLDAIPAWSAQNAGRITLTSRAFAGAKKSLYATPGHIYRALDFLAGPYREYRTGARTKADMETALQATGCQLAGSSGTSVAGTQGEAYFVRLNGKRQRLDLHLRRGGGRDERYCMRIYFFWDDESRQAVVGWLPSHLDNSLT